MSRLELLLGAVVASQPSKDSVGELAQRRMNVEEVLTSQVPSTFVSKLDPKLRSFFGTHQLMCLPK